MSEVGLLFLESLGGVQEDVSIYNRSEIYLAPETKKMLTRWIRLAKQSGLFVDSIEYSTRPDFRHKNL